MRILSADYIFPIASDPVKGGAVVVDEQGIVLEVLPNTEGLQDVEYYEGIICPGFVNSHCHLELSHLKGAITENTGLTNFIRQLQSIRDDTSDIEQRISAAEKEMIANGIVAVGDISNGNAAFSQKTKGNLQYRTFIEVFGFAPEKAETSFQSALELKKEYEALMRNSGSAPLVSIVPHAPYSVSPELFRLIREAGEGSLLTIHNQETPAENEMFNHKKGALIEFLANVGNNTEKWECPRSNSLPASLSFFPEKSRVLFVHNTFTTPEDLNGVLEKSNLESYWCLCPNANLYIENKLPDIELFRKSGAKITIGTDSLASNHGLSVLDELKTIAKHYPTIPLHELLLWATQNGAEALGMEEQVGSLEKGKQSGINLIDNISENGSITQESEARRLV